MQDTRRGILSLIALGRISAAEGERLLAAWNDGREGLWIAVACVVAGLAQMHFQVSFTQVIHLARAVSSQGLAALHSGVSALFTNWGGRI